MIDTINKHFQIILASKSPRRQQLLRELGLKFDVVSIDADESYPKELKGSEIAEHIAMAKANAYNKLKEDQILITADTIVVQNDIVLGKPGTMEEAYKMIEQLSNSSHEVITGVCIKTTFGFNLFHSETKVVFDKLSDEEINYYVRNFRPMDKAGAYGIQEWIGMAAVKHIEGSYFNVMGLPVHQLYQQLKKIINQ